MAELALALPRPARVRGFAKKRLLRAAVEPLVGREIARGASAGSRSPPPPGCGASCEPFCREVLSAERLRAQGYFDAGGGHRLIDEHVARREDHSRQLWGLMCLSLWLDGVAADAASAPAALSGLT